MEGRAFFALMNLLARPELTGEVSHQVREHLDHPTWKPLQSPNLHQEVLPLIRSNLETLGYSLDALFEPSSASSVPTPGDCVKSHFARTRHLGNIGRQLAQCGIQKVVLIKGSAVSRLMKSPALRLMCDIDILVSPKDLATAREALVSAGWRVVSEGHSALRHKSGWIVDLQNPATPLGWAIWESAKPCGEGSLHIPRPEYQAALLAVHCFQGHGEKIWRDIADLRVLKSQPGWNSSELTKAVTFASESGHGEVVAAFLAFVDHLDSPNAEELPTHQEEGLSIRMAFLHAMAQERTSEISFHLMRQIRRAMKDFPRSFRVIPRKGAVGTPVRNSTGQAGLRGLYDVPRLERMKLAGCFLSAHLFSPEIRRLFRVAANQRELAVPSLFESPGVGRLSDVSSPSR